MGPAALLMCADHSTKRVLVVQEGWDATPAAAAGGGWGVQGAEPPPPPPLPVHIGELCKLAHMHLHAGSWL